MHSFHEFINMGGYAFYVWTSYASVAILLAIQWIIPWRKWRQLSRRCEPQAKQSRAILEKISFSWITSAKKRPRNDAVTEKYE